MANSNRVFVSPGVYTSEKDLTFVAQSVGVTTLGLVGETLQGPAFEPILIRNFDEFKTYFGTTSPAKYSDGNPKYELGYVAKSYLQESNQLFVTRVLGLTGYKPTTTYGIKTLGGITVDTTDLVTGSGIDITFEVTVQNVGGVNVYFIDGQEKPVLNLVRGGVYTFNQSNSSNSNHPIAFRLEDGTTSFTSGVVSTGTPGESGAETVFTVPINAPDGLQYYCTNHPTTMGNDISVGNGITETLSGEITSISTSSFIGDLSGKTATDGNSVPAFISGLTVQDGTWFTLGYVDGDETAILTDSLEVTGPIGSNNNNNWYNVYFKDTAGTIDGVYSYLFVYDGTASGWTITQYEYSASVNSEYDDMIILALRSRGSYSGEVLGLEVTGSSISISGDIESNPLSEFTLSVVGSTSGSKTFTCSMDVTSSKYVSKVLGGEVFDKRRNEVPVYVFEEYPKLLKSLYSLGLVRGLSTTIVDHSVGEDFLTQWDTPASPMVVSEVRGGAVSDLFSVVSISDGDAANNQVKIEIQNIDIETGEFDVIVRDFNDTDGNLSVLEKFSRCSMNPDLPGYIARKIGTSDGEYELRSKYVMLNMSDDHPVDAFPAGFKGFTSDLLGTSKIGNVLYKTQYYNAGDIIGYSSLGEPELTNGDKIRKVSLGLSDQSGIDADLFHYKGVNASQSSHGFHLSSNASTITGTTYMTTPYDLEGTSKGRLDTKSNRKFTFAVCGGFDGWDIYRGVRTNGDAYIFGKNTYISGHTTNSGVFSSSVGNSDYYAYLTAIETFSNPESVDINIFATPGIDFYNHSSLVNQTIDMIEGDRADSLYIVNAPNTDTVDEIVEQLDSVELDTNYTATYWPWIQVRDGDNATQLYLPPTGEVVRNIALTDNVSYPWFAVAGYSRGLVNAIKAKKKLTLDNRDELYKARINPIATFSDTGTIIWGNKTLQVRESALDRINVRRLLLRARKLISAVAVRLLFEQNDEQVRNEFLRLVNPILDAIKRERGLFEFRVVVSNDPEDIDANTLRGKIFIKPTRALEFIDVEFLITPTGASFENI